MRRFRARNMMLAATVFCVLSAAACSGGGDPNDSVVTYFAEGDGTSAASITGSTESGGTFQVDVDLPMRDEKTGQEGIRSSDYKPGAFLYLSVQNKGDAGGAVTCRITVGDKVIDEVTSRGAGVIATCRGKMP